MLYLGTSEGVEQAKGNNRSGTYTVVVELLKGLKSAVQVICPWIYLCMYAVAVVVMLSPMLQSTGEEAVKLW